MLYQATWTDPGAVALDVNAFGATVNLTSRVAADGAGRVDTGVVTPPGSSFGYVITYTVRAPRCACRWQR